MKSDRVKLSDGVKPSYVKILSYSPLEKQRKAIENLGWKQINAITDQTERLATLNKKDDRKANYEKNIWKTC